MSWLPGEVWAGKRAGFRPSPCAANVFGPRGLRFTSFRLQSVHTSRSGAGGRAKEPLATWEAHTRRRGAPRPAAFPSANRKRLRAWEPGARTKGIRKKPEQTGSSSKPAQPGARIDTPGRTPEPGARSSGFRHFGASYPVLTLAPFAPPASFHPHTANSGVDTSPPRFLTFPQPAPAGRGGRSLTTPETFT